ncbi:hypothetical protein [Polyangium sorediatum]|uniref:DUF2336 domain-containing protein n=1 Tax=Polyangium sorediatum TaxID=889274 RepID=A0ABT6P7L1_9BACT|nr:hypothetical protein [Polyangium sorediatum]MDI1436597.1 hypothetical protein [Polyangium sorediatum]
MAFLHVLRQQRLDEDDQSFLRENVSELGVPDLLAWRARCEPGFTGTVLRALARIALEDPSQFEYEVLDAPRFSLHDEEWIELADLTRGKVPPRIFDRIAARRVRIEVPRVEERAALPSDDVDLAGFLESSIAEIAPAGPGLATPIDASLAPEAIVERARNAWSAEERAMLLEWAAAHGVPRKPLVEIAVAAVRAGELDPRLRAFLAAQVGTRAAWDAHGQDVVLAFLDRSAYSSLSEICALVWSAARGAPAVRGVPGGRDEPQGLLSAMSAAFAAALVHMARESLVASLPARGMAALSALACLAPPPRLSRSIHDLLRAPGVVGEVLALVELNVRLVKHSSARDASFESIVAAIHCLADAGPEA